MSDRVGAATQQTEYRVVVKKTKNRPTIGSQGSVEIPENAIGVTVDTEADLHGSLDVTVSYLVPESDFDE